MVVCRRDLRLDQEEVYGDRSARSLEQMDIGHGLGSFCDGGAVRRAWCRVVGMHMGPCAWTDMGMDRAFLMFNADVMVHSVRNRDFCDCHRFIIHLQAKMDWPLTWRKD